LSCCDNLDYRARNLLFPFCFRVCGVSIVPAGLATAEDAIFDLDFHAIMQWGHDPALEKHYVPTRSQRARSVLTFFPQGTGTHNLVYANPDVSKAGQAREVIAFRNHWKGVSGNDPRMLIMDQKVNTHAVLGELDDRGVTFLTLHMRSAVLIKQIDTLTGTDFTTITLDRPSWRNRQKVHQATGIRLTGYPGTVPKCVPRPSCVAWMVLRFGSFARSPGWRAVAEAAVGARWRDLLAGSPRR
jgi:hypothetical protein